MHILCIFMDVTFLFYKKILNEAVDYTAVIKKFKWKDRKRHCSKLLRFPWCNRLNFSDQTFAIDTLDLSALKAYMHKLQLIFQHLFKFTNQH